MPKFLRYEQNVSYKLRSCGKGSFELERQGNLISFGVNVVQPLMTSNGTGKSADK